MTTPSFEPQPCCGDAAGASCGTPLQFCRTSTETGPVAHPGRQYDITLPINPGFAVDSLTQDTVTQNAGITWSIFDTDGSKFAADLKAFIESRMAGATVTVTNPNAGSTQVCGAAVPMQIHIECLRLDQNPPNLVELVYNAGNDLIQNPAYNESPPLNPPAPQGNYGFRLLSRQDDPGPFPGNPPANDALCTSVANRGWETNDIGRTFEIWGKDVATSQNTTPTPRGTPVQEITSDGPPPGGRSTIWQTFSVGSAGTFNIKLVHGARDPGEQHIISLSTGDTNDVQTGDILIDTSTPPSVTSSGGPNPWTTFSQSVPLNTGLYTLALSTNNPAGGARGGLFTDMRVYIDRPNTRATATHDDTTCTVTADETQTTTLCEFWVPNCAAGVIASWTNAETEVTLTNAQFWAQTPKPSCCGTEAAPSSGGNGVQSNLIVSDIVCATVNGVRSNVVREALFDPSGGQLEVAFIGEDGQRFQPDDWTPGPCLSTINDVVLCDRQPDGTTVSFLRKYVQTWSQDIGAQVIAIRDFTINSPSSTYTVTGTVVNCAQTVNTAQAVVLCDGGNNGVQFIRHYEHTGNTVTGVVDTTMNGVTPYTVVGSVTVCATDVFTTTGLCLADGTPIGIVNRRVAGTIVQDGWINLLTGTFSAGVPPVGTRSCDTSSNIQQSGVLCDITTSTGAVNGLVIIQYHYNPDGSIGSTDVVNATTGAPYTPVGTITVCPTDTAVPDNDMQVLCDRQTDGSLVPLVRDYHRNVTGTINGFTDYTLSGAAYTVTGTVQSCIPRVSESEILCDSATPIPNRFLRTYVYGPTGQVSTFFDTTLAGVPFTPTGAISDCRAGTPGTANIIQDCADVAAMQFYTSPNLLTNGNFERSTGVAATSLAGPGWTTSYTACGPDLFNSPCGASTWSFFTTTAAQVMSGGANGVAALGARSMAVNVGPSLTTPIILWNNVYLENGKTYEMSADAAVVFAPYDVALRIGGSAGPGGNFPLSTPPTGQWGKTTALFTYAGATGYTSVGLYSNNTAAGGNDHTFDNFSLRSVQTAQTEVTTQVNYDNSARAVIDQVVETAGCNDTRRDTILGDILNAVTPQPAAQLDASVQRLTGTGTLTVASGARSVSVSVLTGPVTVNLGQGVTTLPTGYSATWAVDGPGETVADTFTFTGAAGSDFIVNTTRQ